MTEIIWWCVICFICALVLGEALHTTISSDRAVRDSNVSLRKLRQGDFK
jgi:hypothetical protein